MPTTLPVLSPDCRVAGCPYFIDPAGGPAFYQILGNLEGRPDLATASIPASGAVYVLFYNGNFQGAYTSLKAAVAAAMVLAYKMNSGDVIAVGYASGTDGVYSTVDTTSVNGPTTPAGLSRVSTAQGGTAKPVDAPAKRAGPADKPSRCASPDTQGCAKLQPTTSLATVPAGGPVAVVFVNGVPVSAHPNPATAVAGLFGPAAASTGVLAPMGTSQSILTIGYATGATPLYATTPAVPSKVTGRNRLLQSVKAPDVSP